MRKHHILSSATSLSSDLAWLKSVLPPEVFLATPVAYTTIPRDPGCLHLGEVDDCRLLGNRRVFAGFAGFANTATKRSWANKRGAVSVTGTLQDLLAPGVVLCTECSGNILLFLEHGSPAWWMQETLNTDWHLENSAARIQVPEDGVRWKKARCQELLQRLKWVNYPQGLGNDGRETLEDYAVRYQEEIEACNALLRAPEVQEKVLDILTKRHKTKKSTAPLQGDQVFVGLASYLPDAPGWSSLRKSIVEAFSLRGGEAGERTVLSLPRHAAAALEGTSRKGPFVELSWAVPETGDTPETVETAVALWDPEGGGALTDLDAAFQAARALSDSAASAPVLTVEA